MAGSTLCVLPSFERLDGHEVAVRNDHIGDVGSLPERPAMLAPDVLDSEPPTDPADPVVRRLRVIDTPHRGRWVGWVRA